MSTDWKALCAELLAAAETLYRQSAAAASMQIVEIEGNRHPLPIGLDIAAQDGIHAALFARARAALAQPEPVGATDEQLKSAYWQAFKDAAPCGADESWLAGLRAVARLTHPTPQPIPASERLPGAEDCDAHGWCWVLYEGYQTWTLEPPLDSSGPRGWSRPCGWSHWLPAHALPLPTSTT